jgi:hypothetical protein
MMNVNIWPQEQWVKALACSFLILFAIFGTLCLPLAIKRSDLQPIRARRPDIALSGSFCGVIYGVLTSMTTFASGFGAMHIPCVVHNLSSGVFLGLFVDSRKASSICQFFLLIFKFSVLVRSYLLYFAFRLMKDQVKGEKLISEAQSKKKKSRSIDVQMRHSVMSPEFPLMVTALSDNEVKVKTTQVDLEASVPMHLKSPTLSEHHSFGSPQTEKRLVQDIIRRRKLLNSGFERYLMAALAVVHLTLTIADALTFDLPIANAYMDVCLSGMMSKLNAGVLSIQVVLYAFFSFKLRVVEDAFDIKKEFRLLGWIGLVTAVLFNAIRFIPVINSSIGTPLSLFTLLLGIFLMNCCVVMIPTYKTYVFERDRMLLNSGNDVHTLENVLQSKDGLDALQKFLMKEFASENLFFITSVEIFRKAFANTTEVHSSHDSNTEHQEEKLLLDANFAFSKKTQEREPHILLGEGDMISEAMRIYEVFLKPDAVMEINLSAEVMTPLRLGPLGRASLSKNKEQVIRIFDFSSIFECFCEECQF